jgi:hypothetical protein
MTVCASKPPSLEKNQRPRLPSKTEPLASLHMNRLTLSFAYLGAILIWPVLAYWLSNTWMDQPDESIFLFAALPSLILVPLALIEVVSENFVFLSSALAITGWVLPLTLFLRRSRERSAQFLFLAITSGVSLGQSLLGMVIIAGKDA